MSALYWTAAIACIIAFFLPRLLLHWVGMFGMSIMAICAYHAEGAFGPVTVLNTACVCVHIIQVMRLSVQRAAF